ncbi:MAG: hypothetical protein HY547_02390 [Elusimicrobia bacterium]|nr:hypothetical protein [Elusimicrobiota bacterium]
MNQVKLFRVVLAVATFSVFSGRAVWAVDGESAKREQGVRPLPSAEQGAPILEEITNKAQSLQFAWARLENAWQRARIGSLGVETLASFKAGHPQVLWSDDAVESLIQASFVSMGPSYEDWRQKAHEFISALFAWKMAGNDLPEGVNTYELRSAWHAIDAAWILMYDSCTNHRPMAPGCTQYLVSSADEGISMRRSVVYSSAMGSLRRAATNYSAQVIAD